MSWIRGVKHKVWGLESARQRLQSVPLDVLGKCAEGHRF